MRIPIRSLAIAEADLHQMERDLWKDKYVFGTLLTNGQTVPVKVRYRGGHTRAYPKRSYEVVRDGQTFHYNAEFDDPSLIRNALSFWFIERLGLPSPRTKHVRLFLNGIPLGTYLEIEAVEKGFFSRRRIGAKSLFYAINDYADFRRPSGSSPLYGYERQSGGASESARLLSFLHGIHRHKGKAFARYASRHLDVDNYLKWLAGAVLTGNYDGFDQNYALYRHAGSGKWRMIPWDYEGTWGRNCFGKLVESDLVAVRGYNHLTEKLLAHRPFRLRYKAILRRALGGLFTERRIMPRAMAMHRAIDSFYREDRRTRWSYELFLGEPDVIRDYISQRRPIIARELMRL
ncbi:CotH kinase family protein [Cohnella sp. REN36]|uniref:CotH kinase family protein n=1 Tax=Cohnella sp. REN36 TaxID=2887347 RepID=UPI001D155E08|nr:CotH kinase family protein [Cohnella sp. REN36]MCC3375100.1 CotH kinase family protein [Cohnella sp. REN36]